MGEDIQMGWLTIRGCLTACRRMPFHCDMLEVAFGVAITSVLFSACFLFRGGHLIDGDYALYICQGQSLLEGTQKKLLHDMAEMLNLSTYKYYSPLLYPWGFPLMLAVPLAFFGINYAAFKVMLYLCLLLSFYLLYKGFCKHEEKSVGIWVLLLLGGNFRLCSATDWVLSTLPFMLMVVTVLYLVRGFRPFEGSLKGRLLRGLLLGVALWGALATRTEGFLLLPASAVGSALPFGQTRKLWGAREWFVWAVPYFTVFLLLVLLQNVLPSGEMVHFSHFGAFVWEDMWMSFLFYLHEGAACCLPLLGRVWGGVILFWSLVLLGICSAGGKRAAEVVFLFLLLILLSVWPYPNTRYIMPAIPLLLPFFIYGVFFVSRVRRLRKLWLAGGVLALCVCAQLFSFLNDLSHFEKRYNYYEKNIESNNAQAALDYLKAHSRPTDVIGCCESRSIYLYTGRLSCNLFSSVRMTAETADWYVLFKHREGYLQHRTLELERAGALFEQEYEDSDFVIYRVDKGKLWKNTRRR